MLRYFFTNEETKSPIDELINAVLAEMNEQGVDSPEYSKQLTYLERLHTLKASQRPQRLSRDTMATVVGNLMGILVIVIYEQTHVVTSKAFSQLSRPKPV